MKQQHNVVPRRRYNRLFQDAISVTIPLEVTADMGVALARSRTKRIQKLRESFPFLAVKEEKKKETSSADDSDHENDNDDDAPKSKKSNSIKTNKNMPQRDDYGSVLDYLEAKYAKGVMIQEDDDNKSNEEAYSSNDDDDKRSVYSDESFDSFLDDSELKRDVAGQVMSQSIQTKLQQEEGEDNGFFVNVGNLEVQDTDNLMDYDPLADDASPRNKKAKKKRKRASSVDSSKSKSTPKTKKKASTTATSPAKKKTTKSLAKKPKPLLNAKQEEELKKQKETAEERKQLMMLLYQQVVDAIHNMTNEELPRKKKNTKLSIVVPAGKKAGDSITFSNPHVPGQRLKATVGKNLQPGDKFIVSVPAPSPQTDSDSNKFSREFQDLLDEYSQFHDEWCQANALVETGFSPHKERMKKFDSLLAEFPKNLVTPIDAVYMRKIVRRARQNKHKRKKNQQIQNKDDSNKKESNKKEDSSNNNKKQVVITVPGKGTKFESVEFKENDFS